MAFAAARAAVAVKQQQHQEPALLLALLQDREHVDTFLVKQTAAFDGQPSKAACEQEHHTHVA